VAACAVDVVAVVAALAAEPVAASAKAPLHAGTANVKANIAAARKALVLRIVSIITIPHLSILRAIKQPIWQWRKASLFRHVVIRRQKFAREKKAEISIGQYLTNTKLANPIKMGHSPVARGLCIADSQVPLD
jgi:hypothetical protein